ncbi:MAG: AarF/UbiB family protein, partial [Pseudomonadota bacterium]
MFKAWMDYWRLARAGATLARHGLIVPDEYRSRMPWPGRAAGALLRALPGVRRKGRRGQRFAAALEKLGPAYIKLGQLLATRPDLLGVELTSDLAHLKDKLPPFPVAQAQRAVTDSFGEDAKQLFPTLGNAIAAASIAQVHRIETVDGPRAVKLLRPGVEARIAKELRAMMRGAKLLERRSAEGRRLRLIAFVETLAESMTRELDLRFEAGAA